MKAAPFRGFCLAIICSLASSLFPLTLHAEPIPLKRIVEAALAHSTISQAADSDQQRAFAPVAVSQNASGEQQPGERDDVAGHHPLK